MLTNPHAHYCVACRLQRRGNNQKSEYADLIHCDLAPVLRKRHRALRGPTSHFDPGANIPSNVCRVTGSMLSNVSRWQALPQITALLIAFLDRDVLPVLDSKDANKGTLQAHVVNLREILSQDRLSGFVRLEN